MKTNSILVHAYTKEIRLATGDLGVARKVKVLITKPDGSLGMEEQVIPGPRALVKLISTRLFKVDTESSPVRVQILGSQNNKKLAGEGLEIIPIWRKVGNYEVLAGFLDSQGSKINFEMINDDLELAPTPMPTEQQAE